MKELIPYPRFNSSLQLDELLLDWMAVLDRRVSD